MSVAYAYLRHAREWIGRDPDAIKVLPGIASIIAETIDQAEAPRVLLSSPSHPQAGLSTLCYHLGINLSRLPQDDVLPEDLDGPGIEGHFREVVKMTRRTGLTVADRMREWQEARAYDGFMWQIPYFPGGLESVVRSVLSQMQRYGLFRTEYTGTILRDHPGLARPQA